MRTSSFQALKVALAALACIAPLFGVAFIPPKRHAIWVYPDLSNPATNPITNAALQQQLIANAKASNVNLMFVSVYSSTPNAAGRQLYDEGQLATLIGSAHAAGIDVYAAYGDTDWPAIGCGASDTPSFPVLRMYEIGGYNRSAPYSSKFDGVILDVEPSVPDQKLLDLYTCLTQVVRNNGINMSVAISAFWNDPIGTGKPAYQQIVDQGFTNIVVMGYRTKAGVFGANDNGIVSLDQAVAVYANSPSIVLVGLETKDLGTADANNTQSFHALGQGALDYQAQLVYNQFAANNIPFAGMAVHNYADSYLGGTALWPLSNPSFPMNSSVANALSGHTSVIKVGSSTVSVSFSSVTNPAATVTVLPSPPNVGATPVGYSLAGLSFDVSTNALFTPPATVCFAVPSLDAATFASLRVLHYVNGVAQDQTIVTGPNAPDRATQTICASVNSFSPFVLAKFSGVPLKSFSIKQFLIHPEMFRLAGEFALPAGAKLTPQTPVSIQLGTLTLPLTAAAFTDEGEKSGGNRIRLKLEAEEDDGVQFVLQVDGVDLTKAPEPMLVKMQIGAYVGAATVFADVHK